MKQALTAKGPMLKQANSKSTELEQAYSYLNRMQRMLIFSPPGIEKYKDVLLDRLYLLKRTEKRLTSAKAGQHKLLHVRGEMAQITRLLRFFYQIEIPQFNKDGKLLVEGPMGCPKTKEETIIPFSPKPKSVLNAQITLAENNIRELKKRIYHPQNGDLAMQKILIAIHNREVRRLKRLKLTTGLPEYWGRPLKTGTDPFGPNVNFGAVLND